MSSTAAEKKVKKLARLPSNSVCANCGTTKKFGFSTVCIKYFTFVCSNCKSSHQAISHRCKSLTMSSWTDAEVAELERKGNDYARRTWLKNAPPVGQGGRPKEGDHIDVFKRFVVDVYERKRYYGEDDGNTGGSTPQSANFVAANHTPRVADPTPKMTARAPVRKAAPQPAPPRAAPVADLLDFSSTPSSIPLSGATSNSNSLGNTFVANFDAFAPTEPTSGRSSGAKTTATPSLIRQPVATSSTNSHDNAFVANFDAFAPAISATGPSNTGEAAAAPIKKDPFQATVSKGTSSVEASFDAFAPASTISSKDVTTATTQIENDPFKPKGPQTISSSSNPSGTSLLPPTVAKKPVMNSNTMSQKSSLISSMSMPAPGAMGTNSFGGLGNMQPLQQQINMMQQQQMNMNMMNGMRMNNNSMGVGMQSMQQQMMMQQQQMNMMNGMRMNNNSMGVGLMNNNNSMMMNQQRNMMNGNHFGSMTNGANRKSSGGMQSLQMNTSSMSAWSTGMNK